MPERAPVEKLLLVCPDPALRQPARAALAGWGQLQEARDAAAARRCYEQDTPDLVVLDTPAAAQLLPHIAQQDDAPPVIVLGSGPPEAFACLASPAELPAWIGAALRYRKLQRENKLIREESEKIHGEMLRSYGQVWEHSHELEEEVKRRTVELRHYADELERQVAERTKLLEEQEKMAELGLLVAGIAHDMNTPIGTITSNSDTLGRTLGRLRELIAGDACPESFRQNADLNRVLGMIDDILQANQVACDRIIGIVRSLRSYARLDRAEVQNVNVHAGIDSTLTLVNHEFKNRITVRKEYGDLPPVPGYPSQLNRVFMNMLVNASHAIAEKGTITIRTFRDGDSVKIQIADTGSGIRPEHLARIFDSGFTTKAAGLGTGLGLAICQKIVQEHHGKIDVASQVGQGTTFTITLPLEWKIS